MIHVRGSLVRAIAQSSRCAASSTARSFVTLPTPSKTVSCASTLSRPQRATTLIQSFHRTYAVKQDELKEKADEVKESASETVEAGQEKAEEAKDRAQDTLQAGKEQAEDSAESAKESVSQSAGSVQSRIQETANNAPSAQSATEAARNTAASAGDAVRQGVGRLGEAMQDAAGARTTASSAQTSPIREEPTRTPREEGTTSHNLYIGNLYFEVTRQALQDEFSKHGAVKSCKIISDARGLSKGFGYVEFEDETGATAARNALDGHVLEGRRLVVQYAIKAQKAGGAPSKDGFMNTPSKTVFIGNLSYEMSDKDLNDLFREIKNVLDVRVAIDRRTGQPRGFAHADFIDVKSAEAAAEFLKTREYYGRRLRVDYASNNASK